MAREKRETSSVQTPSKVFGSDFLSFMRSCFLYPLNQWLPLLLLASIMKPSLLVSLALLLYSTSFGVMPTCLTFSVFYLLQGIKMNSRLKTSLQNMKTPPKCGKVCSSGARWVSESWVWSFDIFSHLGRSVFFSLSWRTRWMLGVPEWHKRTVWRGALPEKGSWRCNKMYGVLFRFFRSKRNSFGHKMSFDIFFEFWSFSLVV